MKLVKNLKVLGAVGILSASTLISTNAQACSGFESMLGSLCAVGFNFAPRGHAFANGQLLPISQNQALFSLFGTIYGGDGRTTFALPDLRGRAAIGFGDGPGLSDYRIGQKGGVETVTLNVTQMPSHTHTASSTLTGDLDTSASTATLKALNAGASTNVPTAAVLAQSPRRENIYNTGLPDVDMSADSIELSVSADTAGLAVSTTVANTGNRDPVNTRSPYLAINWIVALVGTFPSRN